MSKHDGDSQKVAEDGPGPAGWWPICLESRNYRKNYSEVAAVQCKYADGRPTASQGKNEDNGQWKDSCGSRGTL